MQMQTVDTKTRRLIVPVALFCSGCDYVKSHALFARVIVNRVSDLNLKWNLM